jgi:copper chaperone CopZ
MMKNFKFLLALMLIAVTSQAQFKSASLQAAGLTCAMCSKAVNQALGELSFIDSITPNIKNSEFVISFKKGVAMDPDQLMKAVEDAGFSVASLRLTGDFNNIKLEKDTHVNIEGKTYHFIKSSASTLDGEKTITVVDKNFVSSKDFKKYAAATTMACIQTGKAVETCCTKHGIANNTRVYHVVM